MSTTDINIINVNGLDYPIKDQEARDTAEAAVQIFAYYESGLVASQAYLTVGTPICWKGDLYYTIASVTKGEIWEVGVNLTPGDKAGLVLARVNTVEDELTANGDRLYFDYQNGKYGYNTAADRGADTFHPFSSLTEVTGYSDKWTMRLSGQNTYYGTWKTYTLPKQAKVYVYCATEGSAERRSCTSNVTNGEIYDEGFVVTISYSYEADETNRQAYYFAAITAIWID